MFMLTKRTSGFWNAVLEAVVKSDQRVPTPMTRAASRAALNSDYKALLRQHIAETVADESEVDAEIAAGRLAE